MRWHERKTVEDYRQLDVRKLARAGVLEPGTMGTWGWWRRDELVADIRYAVEPEAVRLMYQANKEPFDYRVELVRTPCHYGGTRTWFLCPAVGCGRRVAVLFGGKVFACRHCHDLAYASQCWGKQERDVNRSWRLRHRLGCDAGYIDLPARCIDKPKYMHWTTHQRLIGQLAQYDAAAEASLVARHNRLMARCGVVVEDYW